MHVDSSDRRKEKLQEAIDGLRADIDRVEFWADALDRLAQPVPEYQANDRLSRHLLPSDRRLQRRAPTTSTDRVRASLATIRFDVPTFRASLIRAT